MASNLILQALEGGFDLTFHGTRANAIANNNLMLLRFGFAKGSPWEKVKFVGTDGIRAKFMGGQAVSLRLEGKMVSGNTGASAELDMQLALDNILQLLDQKEHFNIGSNGTSPFGGVIAPSAGFIVDTVEGIQELGDGTGAHWAFRVNLVALGI